MLQVKDLVKRYVSKGETVTALSGVSLTFPEKGMVFLLGRSGSGKSTLLNIAGGLDVPDEGEVIVKGRSSKDFSRSEFDSYRNTYVGFIFQEYNILNELTVAENVALALELQGKPKDAERVESLLRQVDLVGLGDRRPNTLSGGQKQRVAIARALVKDPEIIMADEPTGALDSETGKQVLDTLKKLAAEKLVVVVSHDREFAESYADRIIELKDGSVISDLTRGEKAERHNLVRLSDKKYAVSSGASLGEEEIAEIVGFLKQSKGRVVLSAEPSEEIPEEPSEGFAPTREEPPAAESGGATFIKSRFPFRYALKMGLSGLRLKPVRLVFTSLLATVAFIIFGVFSTLVTFDERKQAVRELDGSDFSAAVVERRLLYSVGTGYNQDDGYFTEEDVLKMRESYPSLGLYPVYDFGSYGLTISDSAGDGRHSNYDDHFLAITGFVDAGAIEGNGFKLAAGRLPQNGDEAVISAATLEAFKTFGYRANGVAPSERVEGFGDLEGKDLAVWVSAGVHVYATIVGVVDTGDDFSSYNISAQNSDYDTLEELYTDSFASLIFVTEDFYTQRASIDKASEHLRDFLVAVSRYAHTEYPLQEGKLYESLYASLGTNRAEKCKALLGSLHGYEEAYSYRLVAPYRFLDDIKDGARKISEIMPTLGIVAAALAVFSALLLFNFISASIHAKKKDIGILRAVGARGIDVFKIFIVEGAAITLACFALGCLGCLGVCAALNAILVRKGVFPFGVFLFDWQNVLIVLAIAVVTALLSTGLPVLRTVRKRPVEAIRSI